MRKPLLFIALAGMIFTAPTFAADDEPAPLPIPANVEQINDGSLHGKEKILNKAESTPNRTFEEQMHQTMSAMFRRMETMTNSGHPDKDFAQMLAIHDEGAVALARIYMVHGRNEGLRKKAEALIRDRELNIKELKGFYEPQKK
jgi:uncharacterized protein (DUF305 family)